ncbi:MAG: PorV/PorQ family protein [Bacteroidetes bacterium]|nr:MAG: PorV/PorQ family protein [Bacteroidota bacterium]
MNFKNTFLLCITILTGFSALSQAPKYSNEFLSIGVGGRAMGMSGAVAASVSDATSTAWNPAGLTRLESDMQIAVMHTELFAGISKFDYASLVTKIDTSRSLGFSIVRFATDDIPNTLDLIDASGVIDYSKIKSFSIADYAFLLSYAKVSKVPGLRYGGNVKVIYRKAGEFGKAWGFGFDLGTQYQTGKWQLGLMAKDVTSTFNAWSYNTELLEPTFTKTNNEIPKNTTEITLPKLIFGVGHKSHITKKVTALVEVNFDMTFDGKRNVLVSGDPVSLDPHIGIEIGYADFIFLRGGILNIQKVKEQNGGTSTIVQPNMGLGVKLGRLTIEYALANIGSNETPYSNVFSLKLDINKRK